ncbi:MAG: LysM peptidoglycan-binding domain-containing protein [Hyphomonadaceae bacterium]|nr:LysM peptidoglycan-binding domain-containing protein [Hyphomonadaceae bacterium]
MVVRICAALAAAIVLSGCTSGVGDVRQRLAHILANRSELPAAERFSLPAARPAAPLDPPAAISGAERFGCSYEEASIVVRPGDTLSAIARRSYGSFAYAEALAQANQLADPNHIMAGQVLRLPAFGRRCRLTTDLMPTAPQMSALTRRTFSPPSHRQPDLQQVRATASDHR